MNNALKELYVKELDKKKLEKIFSNTDLEKISAPHLLNIDSAYIDSKVKILFVGKETNIWWGKLKHYIDIKDSISILQQRYRAKFFGGDVPTSKDIKETKSYEAEKYSTPFFTEYKKISTAICNGKTGAVVWSNLLKMDLDIGKGYSKNAKRNKNIVEISKNIFKKEIEILKPNFIIFATSYTYDSIIKDFFGDEITNSNIIEAHSLWKFNIGNIICYRTWHPSTIKYKAEKSKFEYYQDIIKYIQNIN